MESLDSGVNGDQLLFMTDATLSHSYTHTQAQEESVCVGVPFLIPTHNAHPVCLGSVSSL